MIYVKIRAFFPSVLPMGISRGTRRNAVSVVEKLSERMATAFALLVCLRTHREPFCGQNALACRILHMHYAISMFSRGDIPGPPQREGTTPPAPSPGLEPRHQFPSGSPAFPLFQFYETTTCVFIHCIQLYCFIWDEYL